MAPNAPKVALPNKKWMENHVTRTTVTDIQARLKNIGINLDKFQWSFGHAISNPTGFYFTCADYKLLIDAVEESRKTEVNFEGLPGPDLWAKQLVEHIGYIEIGAAEPIGIDFSLKRLGECRVYYISHSSKKRGEAFRQLQVSAANDKEVYREIARRLTAANPPIILDDHIGKIQKIGTTILDGVNFVARDYKKLKQTLVEAKDGSGSPFFGHAILENDDHWALKLSFLATDGTGFREVSRLKVASQPLTGGGTMQSREVRAAKRYSAAFPGSFSEAPVMPDMSSLHAAVSFQGCNIHVDETGFVVADDKGNLILEPDMIQHIFNELIFKTYGKFLLPEGIVRRVNLVLPSTATDFNRVGVSVDANRTRNFRVTVNATCSIFGATDCSATISVSGRF